LIISIIYKPFGGAGSIPATSTNISCIMLKIIRFFNTTIQIPPPRNHFFSHHIHLVTVLVTVDCSEWVK